MNAPDQGSCSVGDRPGGICACSDFGLLLIRLMLATVFIYHGGGKLFGWFDGHGIAEFAKFLISHNVSYPCKFYRQRLSVRRNGVLRGDHPDCGLRRPAGRHSHGLQHGHRSPNRPPPQRLQRVEQRHGVSTDAGGGALALVFTGPGRFRSAAYSPADAAAVAAARKKKSRPESRAAKRRVRLSAGKLMGIVPTLQ